MRNIPPKALKQVAERMLENEDLWGEIESVLSDFSSDDKEIDEWIQRIEKRIETTFAFAR